MVGNIEFSILWSESDLALLTQCASGTQKKEQRHRTQNIDGMDFPTQSFGLFECNPCSRNLSSKENAMLNN